MLFKQAIFLSLSFFSLPTLLNCMKRDASFSYREKAADDDFTSIETDSSSSSHDTASPSSQPQEVAERQKSHPSSLPPLAIPLSTETRAIVFPAPNTPSRLESTTTDQIELNTLTTSLASIDPRVTPNSLARPATPVQNGFFNERQQVPVEPLQTPSSIASTISAAAILTQGISETIQAAALAQTAVPSLRSPRPSLLNAQESAKLCAAVTAMRLPENPKPTLITPEPRHMIALGPMHIFQTSQKHTAREHRIDIAPVSPNNNIRNVQTHDHERSPNCCLPTSCPCQCPAKPCTIL